MDNVGQYIVQNHNIPTYFLLVTVGSKEFSQATDSADICKDLVVSGVDSFDSFAAVGVGGVFEQTEVLRFGIEVDEYDGVVRVLARWMDSAEMDGCIF